MTHLYTPSSTAGTQTRTRAQQGSWRSPTPASSRRKNIWGLVRNIWCVGLCTRWWTATGSRWSAAGWSVCATARGAPPGADTGGTTCAATPRRWPGALKYLKRVVMISNILLKGCTSSIYIKLLLNVLKLQLNLSPCCIAPTMLHLHPPLSYWCFHALSHYLAYVTTELLMITCSVAIRLLLTNVLMHVKMQPIITGTNISN